MKKNLLNGIACLSVSALMLTTGVVGAMANPNHNIYDYPNFNNREDALFTDAFGYYNEETVYERGNYITMKRYGDDIIVTIETNTPLSHVTLKHDGKDIQGKFLEVGESDRAGARYTFGFKNVTGLMETTGKNVYGSDDKNIPEEWNKERTYDFTFFGSLPTETINFAVNF